MENGNNISEKDRKLAESIGLRLDQGASLDDHPDEEIRELRRELNRSEFREDLAEVTGKDRVWQRISDETKPEAKIHSISSSPAKRIIAIAASILLVAAFSLFLFTQLDQPQLVAQSGDTILEVTLTDGSVATLRPNSSLYLAEHGDNRHLYSMNGEIFFEVTSDPNRTFSVETEAGVADVLGTSFNVRDWDGETMLYLEKGSVRLSLSDRSESITLSPGQLSYITANRITAPEETEADLVTAWRNNELVFRDRPVHEILNELEHHYGIQISAPESIRNERLGGAILLEEREESLRDLGLVLGGQFIRDNDTRYRFEPTD